MSRFRREQIGPVTLVLGDALEILPELAAEGRRFGALLTDPPYSSGGNVRDKAMPPSAKYLQSGSTGRYPEFQGDGGGGLPGAGARMHLDRGGRGLLRRRFKTASRGFQWEVKVMPFDLARRAI